MRYTHCRVYFTLLKSVDVLQRAVLVPGMSSGLRLVASQVDTRWRTVKKTTRNYDLVGF